MKKERVTELKKEISSSSFLTYVLKNEDVLKEDLLKILDERKIEYPTRISKERAILLILNDEGLEDLKKVYGAVPRIPFWDVMDLLKINKEQLKLLEDTNYLKDNNVKSANFTYYKNSEKMHLEGTCYSDDIYLLDKDKVKEYLKSITPKGCKIRIETSSKEDIIQIKENLEKIFEFEDFAEYEKRGSGYMNYTYITPKILENENFENRLKLENTRLKEELKKLKSEISSYQKDIRILECMGDEIIRKTKYKEYKKDVNLYKLGIYTLRDIVVSCWRYKNLKFDEVVDEFIAYRYKEIYKKLDEKED